MREKRFFSIALFVFCLWGSVGAAPMNGEPILFTQPNGEVIHLAVFGDEYYAETRTLDGYTVFYDVSANAYFYADLSADGNGLVSSGIMVRDGRSAPAGLAKKLSINRTAKKIKIQQRVEEDERRTGQRARWEAMKENRRSLREATLLQSLDSGESEEPPVLPAPPSNETTGKRVGLTILVEFPDVAGTIPQQEVDDYCNKPGYSGYGNNGSVYDYFYTQSDGKLRYYNVVTAYVMAPHPKSYYNDTTQSSGYCGRLLLNDILQKLLAEGFDFSPCTINSSGRLHAINVFFAGSNSGVWAKGLWPHKSGLSPDVSLGGGRYADQYQITNLGSSLRIATFCHENGHLLCGFPDFYDYGYDSYGNGRYTLMANSGLSTHPTSVGAYLRYHAGWTETIPFNASSHHRACVRVDSGPVYQYLNPSATTEYFLLENRQKIGYEDGSYLPDNGLMIMHCDEAGNKDYQLMMETNHYEVSIEQADGLFHLEYNLNYGGSGDLFHSGDKDSFDDATLPNAHWWKNATTDPASGDYSGMNIHDISANGETMTFVVGAGAVSGAATVGVDRSTLFPRAFFGGSPQDDKIAIWNQQGGTLTYSVSSPTSWISLSTASGTATIESDLLTISYNTTALSAGTHYGQITIQNSNTPADVKTVTVELYVESPPALAVSKSFISLTGAADSVTEPATLMIDNTGESSLSYSISGPSWLKLSRSSGVVAGELDAVSVSFDGTGLALGVHTGNLVIIAPGVANSPITIPLTFNVASVVFLSPISGAFANGQNVTIEWDAPSSYTSTDIKLFLDGNLQMVIAENTANDGSYTWMIPADLPSATNYVIRVSVDGSAWFAESGSLEIWKYINSFESGFSDWINLGEDDFNWSTASGSTGSSGTGPSGASDGASYIYTESSVPNSPTKTADISSHFNLLDFDTFEFSFDYHMYGDTMGSLHLDLFNGASWKTDIWSKTGQQHTADTSPWSSVTIDLSPYLSNGTFDLRFRGVTGNSWRSDMALDNMKIAAYSALTLTNNVSVRWMLSHGLAADNATVMLDSDGDGMSNWQEYIAGTSPVNSNSFLNIVDVGTAVNGVEVKWSAVNGKKYSLLHKSSLSIGEWLPTETGIPGVEPVASYIVSPDKNADFIKVQVEE